MFLNKPHTYVPLYLLTNEKIYIQIYFKGNEFEKINEKTIKNMKRKLIVDCRRIFSEKNIDADYFALGIGQ